jgi:hypothetical protein
MTVSSGATCLQERKFEQYNLESHFVLCLLWCVLRERNC